MTTPAGLPYTPALRIGEWVAVSGQIGILDGALVREGFEAELRQTLVNLRDRLEEVGGSLGQVVKTTVLLADLSDYGPMNEIYGAAFAEPRPTRTAFEVARLPFDARVEIDAWAYLGR